MVFHDLRLNCQLGETSIRNSYYQRAISYLALEKTLVHLCAMYNNEI